MDNPLTVALGITGVGMGLLFLALTFFYGLLSLISAALRETRTVAPEPVADTPAEQAGGDDRDPARRAAAIAIALARAEAESQVTAPGGEAGAGPWWTMHHQRRLATNHSPWRRS